MAERIKKKNLVICRAGDFSLHPHWLEGTSADERNWDLLVSTFGKRGEQYQRDDITLIHFKGGKFDGLYDVFQQVPTLLDDYENIMMADDDFFMTAPELNRFFEIVEEYDLQIAQPTLTTDSFFVYFPELQNPKFKLRFTNFGEAITICLHSKVWRQILPLYENNPMALFIDNFWSRLTDDPQCQVAMIDETPFTHTRAAGGDLWEDFHNEGAAELSYNQWTVLNHKPTRDAWYLHKIVSHAGVLKNGKRVSGRWAMLLPLVQGWWQVMRKIKRIQAVRYRSPQKVFRKSLKNQLTGPLAPKKTSIVIHGSAQ